MIVPRADRVPMSTLWTRFPRRSSCKMRRFAISRSAEDREAATHKALATIQRRLTRIEKGGIEKGNGDG